VADETIGTAGNRRARRPRRRRRSRLWRALRSLVAAGLVLLALPLALLPLYAIVAPPVSTVMLWKAVQGAGIAKRWTDMEDISPHLIKAVISSEDARFCDHDGIDWVEVEKALDDEDGRFRGASTITMQTVKNLFLWTGRDWIRKGIEVPLALYAELVLSKRRILELYLNIAEWGPGLYGAGAAAEHYFAVPASALSAAQAARLAAVLPAPLARNAANPGPQTRRIAGRIAARAEQASSHVTCLLP
jgi:monofunctional biosynthetic peptidoglycan transglycosylase